MSKIFTAIPFPFLDFNSMDASKGSVFAGYDKMEQVFDFVTSELERVGGKAIVEVDSDGLFCIWDVPTPADDSLRTLYLSHMLQSGLMGMPARVIANTAYAGNGIDLARSLVVVNAVNSYVAERDIQILAQAMPLSSAVWLACGVIFLDNLKHKKAAEAFRISVELDGKNVMAARCLTVALTGSSSKAALEAGDQMIRAYMESGVVLDSATRAAYGFALLAAGRKAESVGYFADFAIQTPVMTHKQWREWGHKLSVVDLAMALREPLKFIPGSIKGR